MISKGPGKYKALSKGSFPGKKGQGKVLLLSALLGFVPGLSFENSHIAGYDEFSAILDYNRLRTELNLSHAAYPDFSAICIVDNENRYEYDPGSMVNRTSIYRAYIQYSGSKHLWVVGKQRIPLGVGRFWNPIDVFNPIDIQAVEPDQRPGTSTIRYEYAISDLSSVDVNVAKGKGAIRLKGYLDVADMALVGEWDDDQERDIVGWELEGQLGESGIEVRSEGGLFHDQSTGKRHLECIVGGEYGFENSLILAGEFHYVGSPNQSEIGLMASFQPAMLWNCSLLAVTDLDDGSGFIAPVVEYSLSDDMTLQGGAFLYHGGENSLYGAGGDRVYLRWFIHF